MKLKIRVTLVIIVLIIVIFTVISIIQIVPPIIIKRHVDPTTENEEIPYSNLFALLLVSILGNTANANFNESLKQLNNLLLAYIPSKYKYIIDRFREIMNQEINLLNNTNQLLNQAEQLINIGEINKALQILNQASQNLALANSTYQTLKDATNQLISTFSLPRSEITSKLDEIRELINKMYQRLLLLLEKINEMRNLIETFLTINVTPTTIWTGGNITIEGLLYTKNSTLANKEISILLDGKMFKKIITKQNGNFEIITNIPYIYKTSIIVQAQYIPNDIDSNTYKPTISNAVEINLLYIKPNITLQTQTSMLPGKDYKIKGSIQTQIPLPYSQIYVNWLGNQYTIEIYNNTFTTTIHVPANIKEGVYVLMAQTPAFKIFAPSQNSVKIKIQRLMLNVTLDLPSFSFTGINTVIKGRINSNETIPATIMFTIGGKTYTTNTTNNEFEIALNIPLSALSGYLDYEIYIQSQYPWYGNLNEKGQMLVINPLTILVPLTLVTFFALRIKNRKIEEVERIEEKRVLKEEFNNEKTYSKKEFQWIIDLYWQTVALISNLTKIETLPSMTFREYLRKVAPYIKPIYNSFETLTLVTEKVLYSNSVSIEELNLAKEAASKIQIEYVKTK